MTEEEKHRRIVDAVLSLIAKHGVQGTTTARIAAAVRGLRADHLPDVPQPEGHAPGRRRQGLAAAARRTGVLRVLGCHGPSAEDMRALTRWASRGRGWSGSSPSSPSLTPADGLREHLREQQFNEAQRFAEIVDEGKAQGCIRAGRRLRETAWRIMTVHWLEAMARLHGLEDQVLTGFSTRRFQSILDDIATESAAPRRRALRANGARSCDRTSCGAVPGRARLAGGVARGSSSSAPDGPRAAPS